jgi:hypothetical protein
LAGETLFSDIKEISFPYFYDVFVNAKSGGFVFEEGVRIGKFSNDSYQEEGELDIIYSKFN